MKFFGKIFALSFFFVITGFLFAVNAQTDSLNLLKNVGTQAKYNTATDENSLATTVGNIISGFLSLLGIIFLVFTVYAGYLYLTAGGDEEQVKKAIQYLRNALIGLLIVLSSYGITKWVVNSVIQSTTSGPSSSIPGVN